MCLRISRRLPLIESMRRSVGHGPLLNSDSVQGREENFRGCLVSIVYRSGEGGLEFHNNLTACLVMIGIEQGQNCGHLHSYSLLKPCGLTTSAQVVSRYQEGLFSS